MNNSLDDQNCAILRENNKLKEQIEIKNRELDKLEHVLLANLAHKEQEIADLSAQIEDMKASSNPCNQQLRCMGLDPAVNSVFLRIKKDMKAANEKLEQTQNDLQAWKFTPDSQTGKRMMARMRVLLQENEELGKMNQSGRTAKLESEIAMRRTLIEELKQTNSEYENVIEEMDTETDCFQTSIFMLQQQLGLARTTISSLCTELDTLSPGCSQKIVSDCNWVDNGSSMIVSVKKSAESMDDGGDQQEINGLHSRMTNHHVTLTERSVPVGGGTTTATQSSAISKRLTTKREHSSHNNPDNISASDTLVTNTSPMAISSSSSVPLIDQKKRSLTTEVTLKLEPVTADSHKVVSKKHSVKNNSAFNSKKKLTSSSS